MSSPPVYEEASTGTSLIPPKYLNSLGFIDYNHMGEVPWKEAEGGIELPPEYKSLTQCLALDCEMVGVGELQDSELGRVSIVNEFGFCVYDTFAKPDSATITNFRSKKSGIKAQDLLNAPLVSDVVAHVNSLVVGKILVGHSIHYDLKVLNIEDHPPSLLRDTGTFFKHLLGRFNHPSLKELSLKYLDMEIQSGEHSSIQDAQATLKLYLNFKEEWEKKLAEQTLLSNLSPTQDCPLSPVFGITEMHISPRETDLFVNSKSVFVRKNKIKGAYSSCEEYLDTQFRLLLEDFLRPLRAGVKYIKMKGKKGNQKVNSMFRGVRICSRVDEFEVRGSLQLLVPIEQNQLRDVDWENSKIFLNGSLLVLTPDNFATVKFAVVKYRKDKISEDAQNIPLIVKFSHEGASWTVNSSHKFLLFESPAFYEAYKHTLEYLQIVKLNSFPLKKYIVDAQTTPELPEYMKTSGDNFDYSVFTGTPWKIGTHPTAQEIKLDSSQFEAFNKALHQELTIIQGPPGTGKTFIGIQIIKLLLTNPQIMPDPILIVSYTNHALDQTLEQIYSFITKEMCKGDEKISKHMVLRIGGGSKSEIIEPLTLRSKEIGGNPIRFLGKKLAAVNLNQKFINKLELSQLISLQPGLLNLDKLSPQLLRLLEKSDSGRGKAILKSWNQFNIKNDRTKDIHLWLGLMGITDGNDMGDYYFQAPNLLQKMCILYPKRYENALQLSKNYNKLVSSNIYGGIEEEILMMHRLAFYLYLIHQLSLVSENLKKEENELLEKIKIAKIEYVSKSDSISRARIIGMTTTGAVKYKDIIVMRKKPKVMLVEEAAHVLEAHVVASLTEHCEQMILIGDHKQLRPLTADYELSKKYLLDVSLMERCVRNGIDQNVKNWVQLKVQHRMRPEIADLIRPVIYKELEDHHVVKEYPNVKGLDKNLFFLDHQHPEERERGSSSWHNKFEVKAVKKLVDYFINNRFYLPSQITVIVTYLAQKFLIEMALKPFYKRKPLLPYPQENDVRVSTVDGFQGEENDIIILSLVRSNEKEQIGFLGIDNRVCVALSRARHGFFMLGNMTCLKSQSDTWEAINEILVQKNAIGQTFPFSNYSAFDQTMLKMQNLSLKAQIPREELLNLPQAIVQRKKLQGSAYPTRSVIHSFSLPQKIQKSLLQPRSCGHGEILVPYSSSLAAEEKKSSCGKMGPINMRCGHTQSFTCSQKVKKCKYFDVRKHPKCGHPVQISCGNKSIPKCTLRLKHNFNNCSHSSSYLCGKNPKTFLCSHPVEKNMYCGHKKTTACHIKLNPVVDCTTLRDFKQACGHVKTIQCRDLVHETGWCPECEHLRPSSLEEEDDDENIYESFSTISNKYY